MNRPPGFAPTPAVAALALAILSLAGTKAHADVLPPCEAHDSLINCAATDVGKPCQGAGQCFEITCSSGAPGAKVYRCDACPTIIATPADTCSYENMGRACSGADGGTGICGQVPPHCAIGPKYVCKTPATATPTGPPLGSTGAAGTSGGAGTSGAAGTGAAAGSDGKTDSGGCDVVPRPGKPTLIGLGLVVAGIVFFLIDRARRRSR